MSELMDLSATDLGRRVALRQVSAVEAVSAALERIDAVDSSVNAFVSMRPEAALDEARVLDARIASGETVGELAGVPFGVKDLEDVVGLATTFGSRAFRDYMPERDSVQVERLRAAGAIPIGKTNTPEFGHTAFTRNRLFGTTRNPWNLERTPGGSSGGSAAAVAARMVPLATASDGGGSVRIPACYVGAFGMKATFGRIPVTPDEALGMQRWVDTVHYGPITRCVRDGAALLDAACGYHPRDPNSLPAPPYRYVDVLERPLGSLRIAFSGDLGYATVQGDVMREVEASVDVLRGQGHEIVEIDTRLSDVGWAWAYLCGAEDYAHLVEDPRVRDNEDRLGRGYWRGLQAAARLTHAQTGEFMRLRARLNEELAGLFERYDVLLTPALPTEAFAAEGPFPVEIDGKPLALPLHVVAFTYPFNFSGHPAATIRAGFTDAGLPAGLQIVAERHRDDLVLRVARAFERERPMTNWPTL